MAPRGLQAGGDERSPGCSASADPVRGKQLQQALTWAEDGLPEVDRSFLIDVPEKYQPGQLTPLVFVFHGWGGQGSWYHDWGFGPLSESEGFIAVYPQGMDDCKPGESCNGHSSWNAVGSTRSSSSSSRVACDVEHQTHRFCYHSCEVRKGECHPCDWTTCYDDVGFVEHLLDRMEARYCIDRRRIFAYGCSNGGMFVHQLAQRLPHRFAAITASCGGKPHRGFEVDLPQKGPPVSMLLLSGSRDHTIPKYTPAVGTPWWDGFLYADEDSVTAAYKDYNGCENDAPRRYPTTYTANGMACEEAGYNCQGNASVITCSFQGGHDLNLGKGNNDIQDGPEMAWHFFQSHARLDRFLHAELVLTNSTRWHGTTDLESFESPLHFPWLAILVVTLVLSIVGVTGYWTYMNIFGGRRRYRREMLDAETPGTGGAENPQIFGDLSSKAGSPGVGRSGQSAARFI